jgi:predicted nucleic acid-binding protein
MANQKTYLDTSGLFCLLVPTDARHARAVALMSDAQRVFYTTDWVIGETVNLMMARRRPHLAREFLRQLDRSPGIQITHGGRELFTEAKELLLQYEDQNFPFTDCVSFVVMRALKIHDALTADRHFAAMGFNILLDHRL